MTDLVKNPVGEAKDEAVNGEVRSEATQEKVILVTDLPSPESKTDEKAVARKKAWDGEINAAFYRLKDDKGRLDVDKFEALSETLRKEIRGRYPEAIAELYEKENKIFSEKTPEPDAVRQLIRDELRQQQESARLEADGKKYKELIADLPVLNKDETDALNAKLEEKLKYGYPKGKALEESLVLLGFSGEQRVQTRAYLPPESDFDTTLLSKVAPTPEEMRILRGTRLKPDEIGYLRAADKLLSLS